MKSVFARRFASAVVKRWKIGYEFISNGKTKRSSVNWNLSLLPKFRSDLDPSWFLWWLNFTWPLAIHTLQQQPFFWYLPKYPFATVSVFYPSVPTHETLSPGMREMSTSVSRICLNPIFSTSRIAILTFLSGLLFVVSWGAVLFSAFSMALGTPVFLALTLHC